MNENTFKKYIYENICQCPEQCLPENYQIKNQSNCKEIIGFKDVDNIDFFDKKINEVLDFFLSSDILLKIGNKYYIPTYENKLKLSWENIKSLNDDSIKKLLWLLRKCIIDLLLKKIIFKLNLDKKENFKIYSVGSNNLSSDYDITLYGDTVDKGKVITLFEEEFKNIFYEHSSIVFDTNIYGKSFISFEKNDLSEELVCNNNQTIYVLKETSKHSQIVWALVKYFQDIRNSFGESIFNDMVNFLNKNLNIPHINIAFETRIYLNNKDTDIIQYSKLFSENFKNAFLKEYKNNTLLGNTDYTSLVNFYGSETYFTRGAFLDIVVNKQMCKNKIELQDYDYISSILENSGFFFLHNNKTKYFIRIIDTFDLLTKNSDKYKMLEFSNEYEQIKKILNDIKIVDEKGNVSYDEKYCQWIDEKTFDLLKCEKYTIFNLLFKINYKILNIFSSFYKTLNEKNINENEHFQFYYKFVKKNTTVLGKEITKEFVKKSHRKKLPKILDSDILKRMSVINLYPTSQKIPEISISSDVSSNNDLVGDLLSPTTYERHSIFSHERPSISEFSQIDRNVKKNTTALDKKFVKKSHIKKLPKISNSL
jgi:hypothetical protein